MRFLHASGHSVTAASPDLGRFRTTAETGAIDGGLERTLEMRRSAAANSSYKDIALILDNGQVCYVREIAGLPDKTDDEIRIKDLALKALQRQIDNGWRAYAVFSAQRNGLNIDPSSPEENTVRKTLRDVETVESTIKENLARTSSQDVYIEKRRIMNDTLGNKLEASVLVNNNKDSMVKYLSAKNLYPADLQNLSSSELFIDVLHEAGIDDETIIRISLNIDAVTQIIGGTGSSMDKIINFARKFGQTPLMDPTVLSELNRLGITDTQVLEYTMHELLDDKRGMFLNMFLNTQEAVAKLKTISAELKYRQLSNLRGGDGMPTCTVSDMHNLSETFAPQLRDAGIDPDLLLHQLYSDGAGWSAIARVLCNLDKLKTCLDEQPLSAENIRSFALWQAKSTADTQLNKAITPFSHFALRQDESVADTTKDIKDALAMIDEIIALQNRSYLAKDMRDTLYKSHLDTQLNKYSLQLKASPWEAAAGASVWFENTEYREINNSLYRFKSGAIVLIDLAKTGTGTEVVYAQGNDNYEIRLVNGRQELIPQSWLRAEATSFYFDEQEYRIINEEIYSLKAGKLKKSNGRIKFRNGEFTVSYTYVDGKSQDVSYEKIGKALLPSWFGPEIDKQAERLKVDRNILEQMLASGIVPDCANAESLTNWFEQNEFLVRLYVLTDPQSWSSIGEREFAMSELRGILPEKLSWLGGLETIPGKELLFLMDYGIDILLSRWSYFVNADSAILFEFLAANQTELYQEYKNDKNAVAYSEFLMDKVLHDSQKIIGNLDAAGNSQDAVPIELIDRVLLENSAEHGLGYAEAGGDFKDFLQKYAADEFTRLISVQKKDEELAEDINDFIKSEKHYIRIQYALKLVDTKMDSFLTQLNKDAVKKLYSGLQAHREIFGITSDLSEERFSAIALNLSLNELLALLPKLEKLEQLGFATPEQLHEFVEKGSVLLQSPDFDAIADLLLEKKAQGVPITGAEISGVIDVLSNTKGNNIGVGRSQNFVPSANTDLFLDIKQNVKDTRDFGFAMNFTTDLQIVQDSLDVTLDDQFVVNDFETIDGPKTIEKRQAFLARRYVLAQRTEDLADINNVIEADVLALVDWFGGAVAGSVYNEYGSPLSDCGIEIRDDQINFIKSLLAAGKEEGFGNIKLDELLNFLIHLGSAQNICGWDRNLEHDNEKKLQEFFLHTYTSHLYIGTQEASGDLYSQEILTALALSDLQWNAEELDFLRQLSISITQHTGKLRSETEISMIIGMLGRFSDDTVLLGVLNKTIPLSLYGYSNKTNCSFTDVLGYLQSEGLKEQLGFFLIYALTYPDLLQDTVETFQAFKINGGSETFDKFFWELWSIKSRVESACEDPAQRAAVLKNILRLSRENGITFEDVAKTFLDDSDVDLSPLAGAAVNIHETAFASQVSRVAAERVTSGELYRHSNIEEARKELAALPDKSKAGNIGEVLRLIEEKLGDKSREFISENKDSIQADIHRLLIEQLGFANNSAEAKLKLDNAVNSLYEIYQRDTENEPRERIKRQLAGEMGKNLYDPEQAREVEIALRALETAYLPLYWNRPGVKILNNNNNDYQWLEDFYEYCRNSEKLLAMIRSAASAEEIASQIKETFADKSSAVYQEADSQITVVRTEQVRNDEERISVIQTEFSTTIKNAPDSVKRTDFYTKYHSAYQDYIAGRITLRQLEEIRLQFYSDLALYFYELHPGHKDTDAIAAILRRGSDNNHELYGDDPEYRERISSIDDMIKKGFEKHWEYLSEENKNWYRETLVPRIATYEAARAAERRQAEIAAAREAELLRAAEVAAGGGASGDIEESAAVQTAEVAAKQKSDLEILLEHRKHSLQEFEAELLLAAQRISEFEEHIQKIIDAMKAEWTQIYALLDKIATANAEDISAAERKRQAAADFMAFKWEAFERQGEELLTLLNGEPDEPGINALLADLEQTFSERTRGECREVLFGWNDLGAGTYEIGLLDKLGAELSQYRQQTQIMNIALEILTAESPADSAEVSVNLQARLDAITTIKDQYIAIQALKVLQEYLALEKNIAREQRVQIEKNVEAFKRSVMSKWEQVIRGYISLPEIREDNAAREILDGLEKGISAAASTSSEQSGDSGDTPEEQIVDRIKETLKQGDLDQVLELLLDLGGNIPPEFANLLELVKQKLEDKVLQLIADLDFAGLKKMYDRLPAVLKEFVRNLLEKELETNGKLLDSLAKKERATTILN